VRSRLIDNFVGLVRKIGTGTTRSASGRAPRNVSGAGRPGGGTTSPDGRPPSADTSVEAVQIEYSPCLDGDPDPGEVVWTWVPYEEDPSLGKDRPVVIIGRRGDRLVGVPLTSKAHDNELQVVVGRGPWDHDGRVSYAKVGRLLEVVPERVRREGAVLERRHFDDVVAGVRLAHRGQ
jgi:hypothetical protein